MSLPKASLGQNGPQVNRLGFGAMGLSAFYGTKKPDTERLEVLDQAYALGEHFWDSADVYGDNEDLLGQWFKANPEKRKDIFLATKFALGQPQGIDSSPEYIPKACEKSLQRLGIDQIDLYYCHRVDQKTPIEKTVQAMADLKKAGKIKYLGLSEITSDTLRRAHKVHPITAVQIEYSPFALEIESEQINLLKTCRDLGVAVVAYSPLSRGMLTGTIKGREDFDEGDWRLNAPRFSEEHFPKNLKLVEQISSLAKEKGVTAGQLTLAWLMAQGQDIFPIPGTTKIDRLKENVGACKVVLSEQEEKQIRKMCEEADVSGSRYPESFMKACFADTPPLKESGAGGQTTDILGGL